MGTMAAFGDYDHYVSSDLPSTLLPQGAGEEEWGRRVQSRVERSPREPPRMKTSSPPGGVRHGWEERGVQCSTVTRSTVQTVISAYLGAAHSHLKPH